MTEVKERIVDFGLEQEELREEPKSETELEGREKQKILFPEIRPFYIDWFWPVYHG